MRSTLPDRAPRLSKLREAVTLDSATTKRVSPELPANLVGKVALLRKSFPSKVNPPADTQMGWLAEVPWVRVLEFPERSAHELVLLPLRKSLEESASPSPFTSFPFNQSCKPLKESV